MKNENLHFLFVYYNQNNLLLHANFISLLMKNFIKHADSIQKDFPNFNISSIQKIGEGDNRKAFSVNGEYVFRFPKSEEAKVQMQREIAVLPIIKPFFNIQIPEFKFLSPNNKYAGHKIIRGSPLTAEIYHSLKKNTRESIQHSIAQFLFQLHHIDLSLLIDYKLETMNLKEEYSENLEQAQDFIYRKISKTKRETITQLFSTYLGDAENFKYDAVLIHNDFSKDHILFNTANQHPPEQVIRAGITGIIDFGDIALGDPAYDFMYLLDEFGEDFLNGIFKIYKPIDKNKLIRKLIFFSLANKVQIIIMEKETNDAEALKEAYASLDKWLDKWSNTVNNS